MKTLLLLGLCFVTVLPTRLSVKEGGIEADTCTPEVCKAEDGCRCATPISPLNPVEQTPQLISLTFEEAITEDTFNNYWQPLLFNRTNPDGRPISATFFVPHEYTDYVKVNTIYNHGFEIGVNSITKSYFGRYWVDATEELLEQEFGGQKQIITKFACIPPDDIQGARTPQYELAGNNTIQAYQSSGIAYDSSWPTPLDEPLFPYTLDYLSNQHCMLSNKCPNEAFKGFWILPINSIQGQFDCYTLVTCNITGTSDEIADWLINEINLIREGNREPLTLTVNSYWFDFSDNSLEGLAAFLDKITSYDDVFLVSQRQVLDWMKNPVPLSQFKTDLYERNAPCTPVSCTLKNLNGNNRYMNSCVSCPPTYPWLDNPEGN